VSKSIKDSCDARAAIDLLYNFLELESYSGPCKRPCFNSGPEYTTTLSLTESKLCDIKVERDSSSADYVASSESELCDVEVERDRCNAKLRPA